MCFQAPFAGRVSCVVPFLPFNNSECAIVVHRFLLAFASEIRQPIDMNPDVKRMIGHCRLAVREDGKVCAELTKQFYNKDLGARSLQNAVAAVSADLAAEYSNSDVKIEEGINGGELQSFVVRRVPVADDAFEVGVFPGEG